MKSKEVRQKFLDFFKSKDHLIVDSAPLIVKNDPTLMFTNAGMNQFKDSFLGNSKPDHHRIADTQKCLRVSGKHNDLEEVGHDTYHHTMFEMLGNWSFGDYFKKDAINWAWELLTDVYGLPKDRLYATIFEGDDSENLEKDEEALKYWLEILPANRVLNGSKKDNFWEMGDTGPCGPCSEIHIDLRSEEDIKKKDGAELVNKDHPLVVEVWNLVFMEFNRQADKSLVNLPQKHVDTGMGFERLCMAIQGVKSNYDTDVFTPLITGISSISGIKYGDSDKTDIAIRVIADHVRAVSFAIADGQLPSNTGAGYVIRRILRRAVRYGFTFLNQKHAQIYQLVDILEDQFKEIFPSFTSQKDFVKKVIEEEESSFLNTLEKGLGRLETIFRNMGKRNENQVSGKESFELYDTYGFPIDLTALIARENNFDVDMGGFEKELEEQKNRSRADAARETGDWTIIKSGDSVFTGYESLEESTEILKYRKLKVKGKDQFQIVLKNSPFYAESGGQVGDKGVLETDSEKIAVLDTIKENDLTMVITDGLPKNPNDQVQAIVNQKKRQLTADNHSATHLMHAALRQVLGNHVEQRGSLVNEKILRFDFSHFTKMSDSEIEKVEEIVNRRIRQNIKLDEKRDIPIEEAKKMGAMALFGEKYGEKVRVITFDPAYSVELCGGTHVEATGQIGLFKIVSESSVAAGIRRIEAVTATEAEKYVRENEKLVNEIKDMLKSRDLPSAVKNLMETRAKLEKELEEIKNKGAGDLKEELLKESVEIGEMKFIVRQLDGADAGMMKNIAFEIRKMGHDLGMVIGSINNSKPLITVMLSGKTEEKFNASNIVKEISKLIRGGGGGQPFFATAGGSYPEGLDEALNKARELFGIK